MGGSSRGGRKRKGISTGPRDPVVKIATANDNLSISTAARLQPLPPSPSPSETLKGDNINQVESVRGKSLRAVSQRNRGISSGETRACRRGGSWEFTRTQGPGWITPNRVISGQSLIIAFQLAPLAPRPIFGRQVLSSRHICRKTCGPPDFLFAAFWILWYRRSALAIPPFVFRRGEEGYGTIPQRD